MKELDVLAHIGRTPSTNTKGAVLKQYDTPILRKLLYYTYNPYLTYRVKQLEFPETYNTVQPDISEELFALLDLLASHTVTPTQSKQMIKRLMAKCTEAGATWVAKVISKDLKIGISDGIINKAFKGLVPVFNVMLAHPMVEPKSGDTNWHRLMYPCILETKFDGMRIVAVCDGVTVKFFSREGIEYATLDHLIPQILKLAPGRKFVLDGESIGIKYNPNCEVAKKNYELGKNWEFAQGMSMTKDKKGKYSLEEKKECLGYIVWDILDYDFFMSQGATGSCKPLKYRKTELAGLFENLEAPLPSLKLSENKRVISKEEIVEIFKEVIAKGGEGVMIKDPESLYEFKRSYSMIKMKEFYTADLRIIGAGEGKPGTKYMGTLGFLEVSDDGEISAEVGSGIDDELRLELWFRHKRGELVGGIVEIIYQEITADNSLRIPVFVRERPDKTTISWG